MPSSKSVLPQACAFAVTAMLALGVAQTAESQIPFGPAWRAVDTSGVPVLFASTPTLVPGACYEVRTTDLQSIPATVYSPDPIVSVRDDYTVFSNTIGGADACGSDVVPACARFCVPTSYTSRSFVTWVRAYTHAHAGRTDLRIQRLTNLSDVPTEATCIGSTAQHN